MIHSYDGMHITQFWDDIFWVDDKDEIDLLFTIAKSISKKHNKTIAMCYWPEYNTEAQTHSGTGKWENEVVRFVESDTKFSKTQFYEDMPFRKRLQTNIKNHLPKSIYNCLLFQGIEGKNTKPLNIDIHKKLPSLTAYGILQLLCQSLYEDLYKDKPVFHDKSYSPEIQNRFGFYLIVNQKETKLYLNNKNYKSIINN